MAAMVATLEIGTERVYFHVVPVLPSKFGFIREISFDCCHVTAVLDIRTDRLSNSESLYCPDASNKVLFQSGIGFGRCRLMPSVADPEGVQGVRLNPSPPHFF